MIICFIVFSAESSKLTRSGFSAQKFYNRYHLRSNIESTFSMVKRKFGNYLRTKTFTGQTNEILCKAVCHNIVVMIHEMNEIGVNPELLYGSKDIFKIAKSIIESQKPLNVQEGILHKKGFEIQIFAPFLCKVPESESFIYVMISS